MKMPTVSRISDMSMRLIFCTPKKILIFYGCPPRQPLSCPSMLQLEVGLAIHFDEVVDVDVAALQLYCVGWHLLGLQVSSAPVPYSAFYAGLLLTLRYSIVNDRDGIEGYEQRKADKNTGLKER
jgi:hypothetical protein